MRSAVLMTAWDRRPTCRGAILSRCRWRLVLTPGRTTSSPRRDCRSGKPTCSGKHRTGGVMRQGGAVGDGGGFTAFLSGQRAVNAGKKSGGQGYVRGGLLVLSPAPAVPNRVVAGAFFFFFKQKTAYEIGQ